MFTGTEIVIIIIVQKYAKSSSKVYLHQNAVTQILPEILQN